MIDTVFWGLNAPNFQRRFYDLVEVGWGGVRAPHWRGDWPIGDVFQLFGGGRGWPNQQSTQARKVSFGPNRGTAFPKAR